MADLSIKLNIVNASDNNLVPFYVVVKQKNQIILKAWSTNSTMEGDSTLIAKLSGDFLNTEYTTVEVFNLGKKINNVKLDMVHYYAEVSGSDGGHTSDVSAGLSESLRFLCPTSSQFFGTIIRIYNNEVSQNSSGVDYRVNGLNIESYKSSDASFISHNTPNISNNPNYVSVDTTQTAIPTIAAFTIGSNQSITGHTCANGVIELWKYDVDVGRTFAETYGEGGSSSSLVATITADTSGAWSTLFNSSNAYGLFAFATCAPSAKSRKSLLYYPDALPVSPAPTMNSFIIGTSQSITGTTCANGVVEIWRRDVDLARSFGDVYGTGGRSESLLVTVTANSSGVWTTTTDTSSVYVFFAFATCPSSTKSAKSLLYYPTAIPVSSIPTINDTVYVGSNEISGTIGTATSSELLQVYLGGISDSNLIGVGTITGTTWKITRGIEFLQGTTLAYGALLYARQKENSQKSVSDFSSSVAVRGGQLDTLIITGTPGQSQFYRGDEADITGFAIGAVPLIGLVSGAVPAVNIDYNITNITGGIKITFLTTNSFTFRQSKIGYITSAIATVVVGGTKPTLATPILSTYTANIGDGVSISNQGDVGYTSIDVYRYSTLTAFSEGNYTLSSGTYTFLVAGVYTFRGKKTNLPDSLLSSQLTVVTVVTTPTPIISVTGGNQIQCNNLNNPSISKTIELWKDGVAQTPLITTTDTLYSFNSLSQARYKIRFKVPNKTYTDFSNEINLLTVSFIPIVTSWDFVLSSLGVSTFLGTGVAGSVISVFKNGNINALTTVNVGSAGQWRYVANTSGSYTFAQLTINNSISGNTIPYIVTDIVVSNKSKTPTITTISPIIAGGSISGTVDVAGFSNVTVYRGVYVFGATPTYTLPVTDGKWIFNTIISDFGTYQFCTLEGGKVISDPTTPIFSVNKQKSSYPILTNLNTISLPNKLSGTAPNLSIVRIYRSGILVDTFTIDTSTFYVDGAWSWTITVAGTYQVTITEVNKSESDKTTNVEVIENCGSLHIRTAATDQTLFPNTTTEEIDDNGIKIGIIPETTRTDLNSFLVVVSTISSLGQAVELVNATIAYPSKNQYLYFIIPKPKCPSVGTTISISIKAVGQSNEQLFPCTDTINYTITSTPIIKVTSCIVISKIETIQNTNKLRLTLIK